jgi:H/ACA ribonucleoprotein complex non-core subunit NAF1
MELTHDEGADFELPPAKRQCTQSPILSPTTGQSKLPAINAASKPILQETAPSAKMTDMTSPTTGTVSIPGLGALEKKEVETQNTEEPEKNGILDMLMQHVEAASNPTPSHESADAASDKRRPGDVGPSDPATELSGVTAIRETHGPQEDEGYKVQAIEDLHSGNVARMEPELEIANQDITMTNESAPVISGVEENGRSAQTIPANAQEAEPEAAEWEADSSPLESSSDSDTSDLSSSDEQSDEEMDGEYAMLGLEEQARILMQGDGGSDDEGGDSKVGDKADRAQLRTTNEKPEEVVPKPNITLTDEKIEELGVVEGIVESTVLIKAKVSGEYQVLESGSLLCLKDRTVVGVVAELFGRVEQPMYTIRFTNDAAIQEAGLSVPGTAVYYVEPPHSTFVFTQPLKSIKGSDASNFHDEEVGDDEMEFSDDEAEAEHKRRLKLKRQGRRDDRGGRIVYQSDSRRSSVSHTHDGSANGSAYGSGVIQMNYDDVDEGYTPLARPSNLHMMAQGQAPLEGRQYQPATTGRSNDRGRGRSHGRGRGFDRGRGRGSRTNGQNKTQWNDQRAPEHASGSRYPSAPPAFAPPPTSPYQYQQNFQQPLQQPSGPPQMPAYPAFSPSPISPLPATHFTFNAQQPQQWQQQHQYGAQAMPNYQYGGPQHAQSQMSMPPPGSHINPAFLEALRQHQQGHRR